MCILYPTKQSPEDCPCPAYFHELLSEAKTSEDRDATWKIINKALGKQKKRVYPTKLQLGEGPHLTELESPVEIVEALNEHFTNIAKKLAENLASTNHKYTEFMGPENKSTMYLKLIEIQEILDEIKKFA